MTSDTSRALAEVTFMGWPAFELRQGGLSLHVVPSVGGRLMGIALDGEELCWVNPQLHGRHASDDPAVWAELCGDWRFPLWGGGKTWLAPESAWPGGAPQRDLDSGAWRVTETWFDAVSMGIEVESPVCRDTGLQLRRRLTLPANATAWHLEQTALNRAAAPRRFGLWDVLMLKRPARVSVPVQGAWQDAVEALPGKPSIDALRDQGVLRPEADRIEVACGRPGMFKCGFASRTGEIRAEFGAALSGWRFERRAPVPHGARYAHGQPLELYNAPVLPYFEIEAHSPEITLQPGEHFAYGFEDAVMRSSPPRRAA